MTTLNKEFPLSIDTLDEISEYTNEILNKSNIDKTDADSLNTVIYYSLRHWIQELGDSNKCTIRTEKKIFRECITISIPGKMVDPLPLRDEFNQVHDKTGVESTLSNLGIFPTYNYTDGENILTIIPKKRKKHIFLRIGISVMLGVLCGLLFQNLPSETMSFLSTDIVQPLFSTVIGIMIAIGLPLMFISLIWGIYSIGDLSILSKLGKKVIGRYIRTIYISLIIATFIVLPIFHLSISGNNFMGTELTSLIEIFLNIIPSDLISPFIERNSFQLIVIATVFGVALLALNKKIPTLVKIVSQTNTLFQQVMEWVTALIPLMIFVSILNIMISNTGLSWNNYLKLFIIIGIIYLINIFIIIGRISVSLKISPKLVIKKILPPFLTALTTSSSIASFSPSLKCCEHSLGMKQKFVNFGVPLGVAFSRAGNAISIFCITLFFISQSNIPITPIYIILVIFISGIMALAIPPIAGGSFVCYVIIFHIFNIPIESLGIAVILDLLFDFINTAINVIATPADLLPVAKKMNFIDWEKIQK